MKRTFQLIICIGLAVIPVILNANNANDERTAATLFHNQQYQEALVIWKKMANQKSNAGLYFNIGLAESNLNRPAEAIYAFEQALRIQPLQSEYAKALIEERKKLDNPVIPLNPFFLERWYLGWITLLRPGSWAIVGLLFLMGVVIFYLIAVKALPWKSGLPNLYLWCGGLVGMVCIITALLSVQHLYKHDEGIIMVRCEMKQASSTESPVLRLADAGEKVKIKDQIGEWYYVALLNLDYGWIKRDCFKIITISGSE